MFQLAGDLIETVVGILLTIVLPAALVAGVGLVVVGDEEGALIGLAFAVLLVGLRYGALPVWRLLSSREVPATFVEIVGRASFGAARRGFALAAFEAQGKRIELRVPVRSSRRYARALVPGMRGDLRFSGRVLQSWDVDEAR